jgi:hypothetical protein
MRTTKLRSCCLATFIVLGMQSLADVAREEAQRRRLLEEQGIEGKVLEGKAVPLTTDSNRTKSRISSGAPKSRSTQSDSPKGQNSARRYKTALQKLDRTIRQDEERLQSRRLRLQAERWALPKVGRVSARSQSTDSQDRLKREIEDLETKLKQLRRERAEIYEEGRQAGFLPGELDGKGIIP